MNPHEMYTAREEECCIVYYHEFQDKKAKIVLAVIPVNKGDWLYYVLNHYAERYAFDRNRISGEFAPMVPNPNKQCVICKMSVNEDNGLEPPIHNKCH